MHPLSNVDRPGSIRSPAKSPSKVAADIGGQTTPHDDDVTHRHPILDDVECDVIDGRRRHGSTSLEASLTTDVMEEDDVDDDNEDQDSDSKKRKKTRTVFSRHQVRNQNYTSTQTRQSMFWGRGRDGGRMTEGPKRGERKESGPSPV